MTHAALTKLMSPRRCVGEFRGMKELREWQAANPRDLGEGDWADIKRNDNVIVSLIWRHGAWR